MLLFYVVSKRGVVFLTHFLVDERQAVKFFYVFSQQFCVLGRESVRVYRVCERALFAVTTGAVRVQEISAVSLCEPFWEDDTVAVVFLMGPRCFLGEGSVFGSTMGRFFPVVVGIGVVFARCGQRIEKEVGASEKRFCAEPVALHNCSWSSKFVFIIVAIFTSFGSITCSTFAFRIVFGFFAILTKILKMLNR